MRLLKCGSFSSDIGSIVSKIENQIFTVDFSPLSTEEICLPNEKLGRNKSVGADDIPAKVYKYGPPNLFRVLACFLLKC